MHQRRKAARNEAQLALEAVVVEGGLLSPEWLARVAQLTAGTQSEADYRVPKGLNLRDEIGRYWRIAQAHWQEFVAARRAGAAPASVSSTFVRGVLGDVFGFGSLVEVGTPVIGDRRYPIGYAALDGMVPVVIAPAGSGLDAANSAFGDGWRRRSAFGLAQEFLNAQEGALWGLACDGTSLRIVRDNGSLTRPAWIEADLERIFTEERYADFAALWLLAHETRFGKPGRAPAECALEAWRKAGQEEGTRARDHLRRGFEEALAALGQGFLSHSENRALRAALSDGSLTVRDYFTQLLRLVYRLIFLLAVEERDLLHPPATPAAARDLYRQAYSMRRLRDRAVKRSAHDRFPDLWETTKIVFRGVARGEPRLGLPALAGLFAKGQCPALDAAKLENRALLLAMFRLAWLRDEGSLVRVNWRDMGPEELGSVYESLLELVPQITRDGRQFAFATGGETKGNARKTTGSYYTPDSLVQVLLDSALEPVIKDTIAGNPESTTEALLGLSIVDPACGSGHFLLAAARRVASRVARLQASGTPSAADYRRALRQVVGRCVYGVDLNPMAVELCKVSLWMEAVEPGLPLTFLDSHVQLGNALLGTTPELMEKGLPDAAWDPIEGDDKKTASALKKRNKKSAEGQRTLDTLWQDPVKVESDALVGAVNELDAAPDASPEALALKEARWGGILESNAYRHQKFVADAWCAAFVWPKQPGALADAAPTSDLWRQLRDGQGQPSPLTAKTVTGLSEQYRFFHWHLQFPQVFANGGFDIVLGNPPWERLTIRDQEWFASRDPVVARARNAADRRKKIQDLVSAQPGLLLEFQAAKTSSLREKQFSRQSGYFPLAGVGDVNTFALFAESAQRVVSPRGATGLVVPSGIATTDTTKEFFSSLIRTKRLRAVFDFDNRGGLFPAVQGNVRFCIVVTSSREVPLFRVAAQLTDPTQLALPGRSYELSAEDIEQINPGTLTCPMFLSARDADIICGIYAKHPVLEVREGDAKAGWQVSLSRMLHMGDDAEFFRSQEQLRESGAIADNGVWVYTNGEKYLPLFESKLCDQYNHRASTFAGIEPADRYGTHPATRTIPTRALCDPAVVPEPRYWAPLSCLPEWTRGRRFILAFRNAVSATADSRSLNACLMPVYPAGNSLSFMVASPEEDLLILVALLNSLVLDFVFRQKATGANASAFLIRQLPVLRRESIARGCPWDTEVTRWEWIRRRVKELSVTSIDMCVVNPDGRVFVFDECRRSMLMAELDAGFFHLFDLDRASSEHVLDSFTVLRRKELAEHGEYRAKRLILQVYEEMAEALRTGVPYKTMLDPPPADPRVAHPDTRPERATAN